MSHPNSPPKKLAAGSQIGWTLSKYPPKNYRRHDENCRAYLKYPPENSRRHDENCRAYLKYPSHNSRPPWSNLLTPPGKNSRRHDHHLPPHLHPPQKISPPPPTGARHLVVPSTKLLNYRFSPPPPTGARHLVSSPKPLAAAEVCLVTLSHFAPECRGPCRRKSSETICRCGQEAASSSFFHLAQGRCQPLGQALHMESPPTTPHPLATA